MMSGPRDDDDTTLPDARPPSSVRSVDVEHRLTIDPTPRPSSAPPPTPLPGPPDVQGTLAESPIPNLLVHVLSRSLTGSLVLRTPPSLAEEMPGPGEHIVYFTNGAPAKLKTELRLAPLGQMLVKLGFLRGDELDEALARAHTHARSLGAQLTSDATIERKALLAALRSQLTARLCALVELPPDTRYEFYSQADLLKRWVGDDPTPCDPLATILATTRVWSDVARIETTLSRLGRRKLVFHKAAEPARFGPTEAEQRVIAAIRETPRSYLELVASHVVDLPVARALVYALATTRHLELSLNEDWPLGVAKRRTSVSDAITPVQRSIAPPPLSSRPPPSLSTTTPSLPFSTSVTPASGGTSAGPTPRTPRQEMELRLARDEITRRATAMTKQDHFAVLGLPMSASSTDVQNAFLALARVLHPDRLPRELADVQPLARRVFARIVEAHRTLIDPARRVAYQQAVRIGPHEDDVDRLVDAASSAQRAEVLVARAEYAAAEPLAASAVAAEPHQGDYLALLAWIRALRSKHAVGLLEALQTMDQAVLRPTSTDRALVWRALLLKRMGRTKEALRDFKAAIDKNPKNEDAVREVSHYAMWGATKRPYR